jgi:hypothetical protein
MFGPSFAGETTLPAHFRHVPHAALTVALGDRRCLRVRGRVPSIASLKAVVADHAAGELRASP